MVPNVCDYILEHLDEELSVEKLSEVANFSKFHFHRQFRAHVGVNLFEFIQLMRLKRASYRLAFHPEDRVIDIALEAGFEYAESFSRAFKKRFGQTPSQFRRKPCWESWHQNYTFPMIGVPETMQVEIVDFPSTLVAVLEHNGHADQLNHSVSKFIEWRKTSRLSPVAERDTFGVPFGDPKVKGADFRFQICGVVDEEVPENPQGVVTKELPGGRCAKVVHRGSHDLMDDPIYYLYREWLPESGEKLRDFPVFFHYRNFFPEVAESELLTDIYLPIS